MIRDVQCIIWRRYFTRHVLPQIATHRDRVQTRSATAKSLYVQIDHFLHTGLLARSHSKVLAIGIRGDRLAKELASSADFDERVLIVSKNEEPAGPGVNRSDPEAAQRDMQRFDIVLTDDARCDRAPGVRHIEIVSEGRHRTCDDADIDFVCATGRAIRPPLCGDIRRRFMSRLMSVGVFSPLFRLLVMSDPRCMVVLDVTANALESGRVCDRIFRTRLRTTV